MSTAHLNREEATAALTSCLPAGITFDHPAIGTWYGNEIAEFQEERLAEAGYTLIRMGGDLSSHAATAVLAPSDAQIDAAGRGLYEAEAGCGDAAPWDELPKPTQELYTSQARAMLAALKADAEVVR